MKTSPEIAILKKLLKPGTTVYTVLRHCSSSGMSRCIDLFIVQKNKPCCINYTAAKVMGRKLYPKGFKHRKGTHPRNGDTSGRDNDGGYALNQSWL